MHSLLNTHDATCLPLLATDSICGDKDLLPETTTPRSLTVSDGVMMLPFGVSYSQVPGYVRIFRVKYLRI